MSALVLAPRYREDKAKLKAKIGAASALWHEIAGILLGIKKRGDWRAEFATWTEFCEKCCAFSQRAADGLIRDAEAFAVLRDVWGSEGKAFPSLTQENAHDLSKIEPEQAAEILDEVTDGGTKPAKRSDIKKRVGEKRAKAKVLDAETGEPEPEPEKRCPTCGKPL